MPISNKVFSSFVQLIEAQEGPIRVSILTPNLFQVATTGEWNTDGVRLMEIPFEAATTTRTKYIWLAYLRDDLAQ